jgi:RNA polymerase sigma factor (sigma-70 family)
MVREMQLNNTLNDEIIDRLQKGDREVLIDLYKEHEDMIKKFVRENNGKDEDAEDLLQDALVVLWQNSRKPDFKLESKSSTYIYAVVKNLWLKQLDKRKRVVSEEYIKPHQHSETPINNDMDLALVRNMLGEMGEICQQILLMFYFDGFDMKTIAKANNLANSDVAKSKKHQCLKELASKVKSKFTSTDFYGV